MLHDKEEVERDREEGESSAARLVSEVQQLCEDKGRTAFQGCLSLNSSRWRSRRREGVARWRGKKTT